MMTNLSWSTLIFAALAAVAYWNSEDNPGCNEDRPVLGAAPCCERHRVAGLSAFATESDLEADRRAEVSSTETDLP